MWKEMALERWNGVIPEHREAVASFLFEQARDALRTRNEDQAVGQLPALVERLRVLQEAELSAAAALGYPTAQAKRWVDVEPHLREFVLLKLQHHADGTEGSVRYTIETGWTAWGARLFKYIGAFHSAIALLDEEPMKPTALARAIKTARQDADHAVDHLTQLLRSCKHVDDNGATTFRYSEVEQKGAGSYDLAGRCTICNASQELSEPVQQDDEREPEQSTRPWKRRTTAAATALKKRRRVKKK